MSARVALSAHPEPAHAAGECVGAVLDQLDRGEALRIELALVAVTATFADQLDEIARFVRELLAPRVLVGVASAGVFAGDIELDRGPGVGLLTWSSGHAGPIVRPVRVGAASELDDVLGRAGGQLLVLFSDPFSIPADTLLAALGAPGAAPLVAGGPLAGSARPGGNRMVLDDRCYSDGLVGVVVDTAAVPASLCCSGGALVGPVQSVTDARGASLAALDGEAALDRYERLLVELSIELDAASAASLGVLGLRRLDPAAHDTTDRDRLERVRVLRLDPSEGALVCEPPLAQGDRVVFEVVDDTSAGHDLFLRLGALGWPNRHEALLVTSDLGRAHRCAFGGGESVLSPGVAPPGCAGLGVATSSVLHRRAGRAVLDSDVLTVTVLASGARP